MISTRVASVLFVVSLLAVAACGGTQTVDTGSDLATATGAVLTGADVVGYTGSPHSDSGDPPAAVKKEFATCMKAATTIFDDTPGAHKANSLDFHRGAADDVSNSIEIDPARSDIDRGWKVLSQAGSEPCLALLFESAAKASIPPNSNGSVGAATVTRFDVGVGDRSIGYSVKLPITAAGRHAVAYLDFIFVARDRAGIELDFSNVNAPPLARATQISLARTVYDRVGTKAS